jgi:hypothetical protein
LSQGYVELMFAPLDLEESDNFYSDFTSGGGGPMLAVRPGDKLPDFYTVAVISRRSRHRAGTRYAFPGIFIPMSVFLFFNFKFVLGKFCVGHDT